MSDYFQTSSEYLPLFDHGETAAATRADAYSTAKPLATSRRQMILGYLRQCGTHGATRHEIADHYGWPLSSTCAPCLAILRDGEAIESGRRQTPYGSMAAVIALVDCVGGQKCHS